MQTLDMNTAENITEAFEAALRLKGEAKLQALREIRDRLARIEAFAAQDFSFPLEDIRTVRRMLPDVEVGIARIEGARKAAATRKARSGKK